MSEEQTNELREALHTAIVCDCNDTFCGTLIFCAFEPQAVEVKSREIVNAARTIARFLEWDDVPDDLPLP